MKKILAINLLVVFFIGVGLITSVAGEPGDAKTDPAVVPPENPYKPGETIDIHKNLSDKEWPQLGNTPQRTNYSPVKFDPPQGKVKWSTCLADLSIDNRIQPTVQAIISDGSVYVGTKNGRLFALNSKNGKILWQYQAGGPILHTAGVSKGKVFFGCMDGRVYAVDAASGNLAWTFDSQRRFGFGNAVLLAEDKIFIPDDGGRLYAIEQETGRNLWHYDAGAPVAQSAAYDAGKVYVASEDMRVHAVKADDGALAWRSEKLSGISFRYFHPVVIYGKVIVRSLAYGPFHDRKLVFECSGDYRSLFSLDGKTGKEDAVLPHWTVGHDGPMPPPAVTRDGFLVVPWSHPDFVKNCPSNAFRAWALQDSQTGKIVMPLLETKKHEIFHGKKSYLWYRGCCAGDENMIASVAGDVAFVLHFHGFRNGPTTSMTGAFHLLWREWHVRNEVKTGWERTSQSGNNQQAGGMNAASLADGLLYHLGGAGDTVVCFEPANDQNKDVRSGTPEEGAEK
ncbi:MAG: PQQ-like beta-propeller repeat protein [Planctomycetes bacterium]|nr:PQQ-like beta-propeller repeat protein [Planctomycetota bacterium]